MTPEDEISYRQEVMEQREHYQGIMQIYLGLGLEGAGSTIISGGTI